MSLSTLKILIKHGVKPMLRRPLLKRKNSHGELPHNSNQTIFHLQSLWLIAYRLFYHDFNQATIINN